MTGIQKQVKYAYLTTLLGVVLATITTGYTAVRTLMASQRLRAYPSGNFTGTRQFGNFMGTRPFANMNPYGGLVNNLTILGVMIAIIGVLWLGLLLRARCS